MVESSLVPQMVLLSWHLSLINPGEESARSRKKRYLGPVPHQILRANEKSTTTSCPAKVARAPFVDTVFPAVKLVKACPTWYGQFCFAQTAVSQFANKLEPAIDPLMIP
jgi:hypothetical protein